MNKIIKSKSRNIAAIVAMDDKCAIGKENKLPWHLPNDLKRFKAITMNHVVIMGRKTYESIGKPLPDRLNIILSQDSHFKEPNCIVHHSLTETLHWIDNQSETGKTFFIIGGSCIYKIFLPYIKTMYLTRIKGDMKGDTFFPDFKPNEWIEIHKEIHLPDGVNKYTYSFYQLLRKNSN